MHRGAIVAAIAAFLGAIIVAIWLPARAATTEVMVEQDAEEATLERQAVVAGD
jgi:hypothetical protein